MFLMTSILFASALAAIPVIVHLLHRQQITPIAWGAMQFLLETPLKVKRRRRIDNWLLMLLRIAILLLLVFLLSRPVVKNTRLISAAPIDVAIVIDHSLTMGRHLPASPPAASSNTLFEQSLATAERLSTMLPASATLSIVLAEHTPQIVTPTPIKLGLSDRTSTGEPRGEWAKTLTLLHQLKPGMTRANIPAAVGAARDLLSRGYNTRKLILILSDDQRSNWSVGGGADESLWKLATGESGAATPDDAPTSSRIPIYSFTPAAQPAANAPNLSVRAVTILPAFIGIHRPAVVIATLTNSGPADLSNIPLRLAVDGRPVATQSLALLPAGQSVSVRIDHYFADAGSHFVTVQADLIDALEADNSATAAVNVAPKLPVLLVDGQLTPGNNFPHAAYLAAAMQPVDPSIDPSTLIDPKIISVSQLGGTDRASRLEDFPIVILNDVPRLPRDLLDRLAEHAQRGNGIWIILGPRTEESFLNAGLAKSTLAPITAQPILHAPTASTTPPTTAPAPISVDIREPANPSLAALTASSQNALAGVNIFAWWPVAPASPQMRTLLATTSDGAGGGDPLALEMEIGKAGGRVILWTTSLGSRDATGHLDWNNLPLVRNFVPLVNETLFHLASGQNSGQPRQLDAGAPLLWTGPSSKPIDSATLLAPDGTRRTLQPQVRGDSYLISDKDTNLPGLYELRFTAPPTAGASAPPPVYFSVNLDPAELDPAPLAPADVDWLKKGNFLTAVLNDQSLPQALGAQQGGVEVWWLLGLLLLAFLVLEVLLTRNLGNKQGAATLESSGLSPAYTAPAKGAA